LVDANSTLKRVSLDHNDIITDFTILALVEALSNNSTVEQLSLAGCVNVTTAGWVSFSPLFSNSDLKKVDLGWNWETVNDEVITSFVEELRENTTLESLGLNRSTHLITNNGWRELSNLLCENLALMQRDVTPITHFMT
jgi:hypothetical protein